MTLDEAIKHAEEVAEENEKLANTYESFKDYGNPKSSITSGHEKCLRCAKEHRQLAEWLKDYKRLLDVLDKIKAEINEKYNNCDICEWFENYDYDENDISEYESVGSISDIIEIIDKYKTESNFV